jgi:hypothetical protein
MGKVFDEDGVEVTLADLIDDEESVTLDPQQFTRWREVKQYAEAECGGDIAAAMVELVNCGLSHIHPYRPTT